MKNWNLRSALWAALAASAWLLAGCSETVDSRQLESVQGLTYKRNNSEPFSGKATNYPMGDRWNPDICQVNFKKGLLDGDAACYIGKIKTMEGKYSKGKLDGPLKRWSEQTGHLTVSGFFKDGEVNGQIEYYDAASGKLQRRANFKDGKAHGLIEVFNPDFDKRISRSEWVEGHRHGEQKEWNVSGEVLLTDLRWETGKQSGVQRFSEWEEYYKSGNLHGTVTHYIRGRDTVHVGDFSAEKRRIEELGGGSYFIYLNGGKEINVQRQYVDGVKVSDSGNPTIGADSSVPIDIKACTTEWERAYRKVEGEDAMIKMPIIEEWESSCRQGKRPG